ncbi:hypothetical protein ScalyP_jg358, partial [Parmales sp. scaly parma]
DSFHVNFQIHLTNPQIQLHSKKTSGSVVVAMTKAFVESREFVNFVQDNSHNWAERGGFTDSLQAGVLRKIDSRYKIEGVEAYAMPTDVDVTAGLQWLNLIPLSEKEKLEKAKEEEIEFFRGGKVSPGPTSNPAGDDDDETSRDSEVDPTYSSIESLLLSKNVVPVRESVASSFASAYEEEETGLQLPATATTTTTTTTT